MASTAIPLIISGLAGIGGGLLNRGQKQTQTGQVNTIGDTTTDAYSLPTYDSYAEELRQKLIALYGRDVDQDPNLAGYQAQGQSNINQVAGARDIALRNSLASRGLSYSPIAPIAQQTSDNARLSDQSQFLNSIPLLQQQLQREKLNAASGFFKGLPVGGRQYSSGVQHQGQESFQEGNIPGNPLGGAFGNFSTTLAGLYGQGAFGGGSKFRGNQTGAR